eukprot:CAMPEP_0119373812 /NCGR_PEP_ID=MMETSP1334-20130426/27850_1 /TAXON_ID=127549 /ORGANISM="Calcidiscus leptoporus, Strain RCC1130" /LENGTH=552 /DNA_ID=CAMNT_0007391687 /DNA_START=97 /DNA_END=1755 /DNA_ORIENTATION=+
MTNGTNARKTLMLRSGAAPPRCLCWYDPTPVSSLDQMVRRCCALGEDDYLLCEDGGLPVALSSSMPSGIVLHVERVPQAASVEAVAAAAASNLPAPSADAVVVIDPISTGAVLAHAAVHQARLRAICVWSEVVPIELRAFVAKGLGVTYSGVVQHEKGELLKTVAKVRAVGIRVAAVMVGCETGVLLGDQLSEALGCRTNGTAKSPLRRNKFSQMEAVRAAKLNACGQELAHSKADVEAFLASQKPATAFKAVVKPVEGAGSDGVFICDSPAQVRSAFSALEGTKNVLGLDNYAVLLQEFLKGEEYVVDTVSRDGVHKCVAIWKYDKRIFNGAPVVYFGMRLLPVDAEPELKQMVQYTFDVLDALDIKHGAMHSEIKLEERGPVLVEVNCRLHGGEGTWAPMAERCIGYSAVTAMLDAYLDPAAFAALPSMPGHFRAHAMEAKLRSAVEGILTQIDETRWAEITSLSSFVSAMVTVAEGKPISKTVDAVTASGNINLVNTDKVQLEADYQRLHELVDGLFTAVPESSYRKTHMSPRGAARPSVDPAELPQSA